MNDIDKLLKNVQRDLDRELAAVDQSYRQAITQPTSSSQLDDRIPIGTNQATGKLVYLEAKDFLGKHAHLLGVTGMGKTFFLDYLIRTFINRGWGVCLIDPMGGLYERMLNYAVRRRLESRTILIDPNDEDWSVGLNLLEHDPAVIKLDPHVEDVMREITLVLGEERGELRPVGDRWLRNALTLLAEAKLSTYELQHIAHPDSETAIMRRRILSECRLDVEVRHEWEVDYPNLSKNERSVINSYIKGRSASFSTPHARRIFGQLETTVDFKAAMDEGKLVLVNLNAGSIGKNGQRMLGVETIYKIKDAAMGRKKIDRPFIVFVDEFGTLVNEQIIEALDTLRQRGVYFYLSHQRLEQLRDFSENLRSAVLESTRLKFIFRVGSPNDRRELAEYLFAGQITGDKVKLTRRAFAPITEWVDIRTKTGSAGGSEGATDGTGQGGNTGAVQTQLLKLGEGIFSVPVQSGATSGQSDSQSWQEHHAKNRSDFWQEGESITSVPMTTYKEYEEISQFYSIEEVKQQFADRLLQDVRAMHFKDDTNKPIPLITPDVEEYRVRTVDVKEFKKTVYAKCARPSVEVDKVLEARRIQLLTAPAEDATLSAVEEKIKERVEQGREPLIITTEVPQQAAEPAAAPLLKPKRVKVSSARTKKSKLD